MTDRELMQQALDALHQTGRFGLNAATFQAIEAIRARLAQPEHVPANDTSEKRVHKTGEKEPEPVAWISDAEEVKKQFVEGRPRRVWWECNAGIGQPLYTAPPQREWQGLTDEEIYSLYRTVWNPDEEANEVLLFARAIEAMLKEKNA